MTDSSDVTATEGDWVRIYRIELRPEERADSLPEDTREVPLEMWMKGKLVTESAKISEQVTIETPIGRKVEGELVEVNPVIPHGFGSCVPELADVGVELKEIFAEIES